MQLPTRITSPKIFYIFTGKNAEGNSAQVILVEKLPDLSQHQILQAQNHQETTTTYVYIQAIDSPRHYAIRWFNRSHEIQRCIHGTLAAAAFVQGDQSNQASRYIFQSQRESLIVFTDNSSYKIRLPLTPLEPIGTASSLHQSLPKAKLLFQSQARDGYIIAKFSQAKYIQNFMLDDDIIQAIKHQALIITARDSHTENRIVFRYFAPQYGQTEDAATGSAASVLWTYWQKIGNKKNTLDVRQLSPQGGVMQLAQEVEGSVTVKGNIKKHL